MRPLRWNISKQIVFLDLFFAVLFEMGFHRLFRVPSAENYMPPSYVGMVCSLLVTSCLVMLGRFLVMACGMRQMLCCFLVMLCGFLRRVIFFHLKLKVGDARSASGNAKSEQNGSLA